MNVVWTETALGHLTAIRQYIAQNSPVYAERQIQRVLGRAPQLAAFPDSGRIVPELGRSDIREVLEGSYRIIYRRGTDIVQVLAIIHARRSGPGSLER